MERLLGRFSPQLYALMRIAVGLLFAFHGAQKLFGGSRFKTVTIPPATFARPRRGR